MFLRLTAACYILLSASLPAAAEPIRWKNWSEAVLAEARDTNRFIILDLEAVWCHWCHVMEETTYADERVRKLIGSNYLAIRVDQDANPDLSARYGDWGWPATIIFSPDGRELAKRRGYIEPDNMASLLQAVIDDPTPGPSVTANEDVVPAAASHLSDLARQKLIASFAEAYDADNGGWGRLHKFIDVDSMDLVLARAERGDAAAAAMAKKTLDGAMQLIDPVAGGIYQYSDSEDWRSPHYEKIMWYQANGIRQFAEAGRIFNDEKYLGAARSIARYLTSTLVADDGAFRPTQDADLDAKIHGKDFYVLDAAGRTELGRAPRIDPNLYARENGWAISGLVTLANVAGDSAALEAAKRAANWVIANRRLDSGGYRHGDNDRAGPYLGDTVAFGTALIDLYAATGERRWLDLARDAGRFLTSFKSTDGGFVTSIIAEGVNGVLGRAHTAIDEQVQTARFANRLARYLGDRDARDNAEHAMRYLASDSLLASGRAAPGTLLIDDELGRQPTHITVVGHKDDTVATALHDAARAYPSLYVRIDWWDKREGPLANPDVTYPELPEAAAYACSNRLCSLPAFSVSELNSVVRDMAKKTAGP